MPMVSMIIPVYNAEKTLKRTLESIVRQTYVDFEAILINDGSADNSLCLCEQYAEKDGRFKVISQENAGPSSARNRGIRSATGKYLLCVDADDVLHENAIQVLVKDMEETAVDVCIFSWNTIYEDGRTIKHVFEEDELTDDLEKVCKKILGGNYKCGGGNPWNKIWRLKSDNNDDGIVLFNESIRIYEDMLWTLQNLERADSIFFEEQSLYDYYILSGSISRGSDILETKKECFRGAQEIYDYVSLNHKSVMMPAKLWLRNRLSVYLRYKKKFGEVITDYEKQLLKSFQLFPMEGDQKKAWFIYMYMRILVTFSK